MQRLHNKNEQLRDDNPSIYHLAQGGAKYLSQEYEDSIAHFNTAIQLNPAYTEAYAARGGTNLQLSKFAEAIADCDAACAYNLQITLVVFGIRFMVFADKPRQI